MVKVLKNTGNLVNMGYFTNLALFYDDVSMTSLVGHGEVTSADVIGRRGSGWLVRGGGEVATQSAVSWTNNRGRYERTRTWQRVSDKQVEIKQQ